MSAKEKGVDLKAAALGQRDGNVIVVNSEIQDPSGMKGKTFAIPSTQSSHYILLQDELAKAGLTLDEIAVTQGFGTVLARSEELWEDSLCCGLISGPM